MCKLAVSSHINAFKRNLKKKCVQRALSSHKNALGDTSAQAMASGWGGGGGRDRAEKSGAGVGVGVDEVEVDDGMLEFVNIPPHMRPIRTTGPQVKRRASACKETYECM
jgi:hypothetical protein